MVSLVEPTTKSGAPRRLALCIEYDGTPYNGFQSQSTANTIQDKLEEALFRPVSYTHLTLPTNREV